MYPDHVWSLKIEILTKSDNTVVTPEMCSVLLNARGCDQMSSINTLNCQSVHLLLENSNKLFKIGVCGQLKILETPTKFGHLLFIFKYILIHTVVFLSLILC